MVTPILEAPIRIVIEGGRAKLLREVSVELVFVHPNDAVFKSIGNRCTVAALRDHGCAERQAMECPDLLKFRAVIEMAIQNCLGLSDIIVSLVQVQRFVKHGDRCAR
jgi:hypothetical protein